jgi:CO/xanthine dehydrogenase FAD-binding subunit
MSPAAPIVVSPHSLEEALAALAADPDLLPVAGCTDLMVCAPVERSRMGRVLNLLGIPELRGLREADESEGGGLAIGAATTFTTLARAPVVRERYPALAAAASSIGGWQIQNRATLGGNLVNASPAGDSLPVLLALGATVEIAGPEGRRWLPYSEFHTGYRETALGRGELLTAVRLPRLPAGSVQRFRKVGTREAQAISKVVVALWGRVEDGRIAALKLGAGSVAAVPVRLRQAEQAVLGRAVGEATAALAGEIAAAEVEPIDDVRSTAAYRRFALERVVRRLVLELGG